MKNILVTLYPKREKNITHIKARIKKGKGIVNRIMSLLGDIVFGKYYFQVALILRNALLVSSMLCNSESWHNITTAELDLIETIDELLLRKILISLKKTPKIML